MKILYTTMGFIATACACAALAAPAMAAEEFVASRLPMECSEASVCTTQGHAVGGEFSQVIKLGVFEIKCNAKTKALTVGEGAITWESNSTFATEIKFTKCLTVAKYGSLVTGTKTNFNENKPMKIVYHINGFAEFGTGETVTEVELGGAEASFKIAGKVCKINWPAQTVPAVAEKKPEGEYSAVTYSNNFVGVPQSEHNKFPSL